MSWIFCSEVVLSHSRVGSALISVETPRSMSRRRRRSLRIARARVGLFGSHAEGRNDARPDAGRRENTSAGSQTKGARDDALEIIDMYDNVCTQTLARLQQHGILEDGAPNDERIGPRYACGAHGRLSPAQSRSTRRTRSRHRTSLAPKQVRRMWRAAAGAAS